MAVLAVSGCDRAGDDPDHPAAAVPCGGAEPAAVVPLDNSAVRETYGTFRLDRPTTLWWTSETWQPAHNLGMDNPTVGRVWLGRGAPPAAGAAITTLDEHDVAIEPELWTRTELAAGRWWVRSGGTGAPTALVAAACEAPLLEVAEQVPAGSG